MTKEELRDLHRWQLERICNYFFGGNKTKFGKEMVLKNPASMATYMERGTYDACEIKKHFPTLRSEWIIFGKGDMLITDTPKYEPFQFYVTSTYDVKYL